MLDILKFIFSLFCVWFGTLLLLIVFAESLRGVIQIITIMRKDKE